MPRVLIADDEDSMRSLVARAIAMDGHETVTAEDGADALDILTREQGLFDLLLTDIQMPVMDGIALALTAARGFSQPEDPADDGLRRPARTRLRPQCDRARRGDETVFGARHPYGCGRCAGGAEERVG
ncbi:CheY-like chemotaxis protein [Bradyrhizobium sp. AZCC 1721]